MTDTDLLNVYVQLTADLYNQLALEQEEHAATRAEVAALTDAAQKRDRLVASLHDHIAALERPPRVPSCGHPPT